MAGLIRYVPAHAYSVYKPSQYSRTLFKQFSDSITLSAPTPRQLVLVYPGLTEEEAENVVEIRPRGDNVISPIPEQGGRRLSRQERAGRDDDGELLEV
jgi:hypothetical protein